MVTHAGAPIALESSSTAPAHGWLLLNSMVIARSSRRSSSTRLSPRWVILWFLVAAHSHTPCLSVVSRRLVIVEHSLFSDRVVPGALLLLWELLLPFGVGIPLFPLCSLRTSIVHLCCAPVDCVVYAVTEYLLQSPLHGSSDSIHTVANC